MTIYLTGEDLVDLVGDDGLGPIADLGLLDSAAHRPRSSAFGKDAYPGLAAKAAALLHSIARNHALVDGNKRLAWTACRVFLIVNGADAVLDHDAAYDLVMAVAQGQCDDVDEIAQRLCVTEQLHR